MKSKEIRKIIERETRIWIQAYPRNKSLLKLFSNKLEFELS